MSDYAFLGIDENASPEEIRKAYKNKALQYHPDKQGNEKDMQRLNDIYSRLKNILSIDSFLERDDPIAKRFGLQEKFEGIKIIHEEECDGKLIRYIVKFHPNNTVTKEKITSDKEDTNHSSDDSIPSEIH